MTRTELDDIKKTLEYCRIGTPCNHNCPMYMNVAGCAQIGRLKALNAIELLEKELIDERYRNDRLQDWTVARDKQHEEQLHGVWEQMRNLCRYHRPLRDEDGKTENLCQLNTEQAAIYLYRCTMENCPFFPHEEPHHAEVSTL